MHMRPCNDCGELSTPSSYHNIVRASCCVVSNYVWRVHVSFTCYYIFSDDVAVRRKFGQVSWYYSKVDSTDWPHFNFSISYIKLILCDTLQLLKGKLLIISAKNLASIKQNIALRGFFKTKSIKKLIAYFFKFFAILRRIDNASDFL